MMKVTCITSEHEWKIIYEIIEGFPTPGLMNLGDEHYVCFNIDTWKPQGVGIGMIYIHSLMEYEWWEIHFQRNPETGIVYDWFGYHLKDLDEYLKQIESNVTNEKSKIEDILYSFRDNKTASTKTFNELVKRYTNQEITLDSIPDLYRKALEETQKRIDKIGRSLKRASTEDLDYYIESFRDWDSNSKVKRLTSYENISNYGLFYIYWMIAEARGNDKKVNTICIDIEDRIKNKNHKLSEKKIHVTDLFFSNLPQEEALSNILTDDIKDLIPDFMHRCS